MTRKYITLRGIRVEVVSDDKEAIAGENCMRCVMNIASGGPGCPNRDEERQALGIDTDCVLGEHHYEAV